MPRYIESFPDVSDVTTALEAMGVQSGDIAALDIEGALEAVESQIADLCGGECLVEPTAQNKVQRYSAPDGVVLPLLTPLASSPDLTPIGVSIERDGETVELLEGVDYRLWPESAASKNLPFTGIFFEHSIRAPRNGLLVAGVAAFGTRLSKAQFDAIVGGVIVRLYPVLCARVTGATASMVAKGGQLKVKQIGQLREEYSTATESKQSPFGTQISVLGESYDTLLEQLQRKPLTA